MAKNNPRSVSSPRTPIETLLWIAVWGSAALFALWPVTEVLAQSLLRNGVPDTGVWQQLFGEQRVYMWNSLQVAVLVTLCTVPTALSVALFLAGGHQAQKAKARWNQWARHLVGLTLLLSMISPPFVGAMAFIMLFGRRGLITWKLLGLDWNPYGLHGVVIMESFSLVALATMLLVITLKGVDRTLENASRDLGMSAAGTLWNLTLPLCLPGIGATALLVFVRALSDFATPLFVGGAFQVLASRAYMALIHMGDFQLASAMNVLLLVPALAAVFVMRRLGGGKVFSLHLAHTEKGAHSEPGFPLPCALAWLVAGIAAAYTAAQWLLYGLIAWGSVSTTWGVDFTPTLDHLRALLDFRSSSIVRSLCCSLAAATGGSLLGVTAAWLLRNTSPGQRQWAESLLDIPYMLPGTFFGLGYVLAFSRLPFEVSASVLIALNCLYRQLSPALRASVAGMSRINPELENAVRDLGAGPGAYFKDVLVPLLRPSALFAFVNAFSAAMISTGPIIFLVTPYAKVMSVDMFESINSGKFGAANAMAMALIVLVLTVNLLAVWMQRRWSAHARF